VPIAACLCVQGQNPPSQPPPGQNPPANAAPIETRGTPPRPAPTDYPDQGQAGKVTIAAEFQGHSIPTARGNLTTEDYLVVETGFFGPPGARIKLSFDDFALRINGKKALPGQPYGAVLGSVKDPEWQPPEPEKPKTTGIFSGDDEGQQKEKIDPRGEGKEPPFPVKIPIQVQRAMAQSVHRAALPEGDRALPVAGLVFFPYRGGAKGIHSVELTYDGPAGKVTLALQP